MLTLQGLKSNMASDGSYELYDGRAPHLLNSREDELSSPPGGPSLHPPGSPKQTRDLENERLRLSLLKSQQESGYQKSLIEELRRKLNSSTLSEPQPFPFDNMPRESAGDDDIKDSRIRQLQRLVTILQAGQYKSDQRIKELVNDKNVAIDRVRSLSAKLESSENEIFGLRQKVSELELTIRQQTDEIEKLLREKQNNKHTRSSILARESYDTASPPSSSSIGQTNGVVTSQSVPTSSSLAPPGSDSMDSQAYSRELDCLHKMVDMLRATVMEQRNVFIKMGLNSQSFNKSAQGSNVMSASMPAQNIQRPDPSIGAIEDPHNTSNNIATTKTAVPTVTTTSQQQQSPLVAMVTQPVRQAEESCEMAIVPPSNNNNMTHGGSLNVHSSASRGGSKENSPNHLVPVFQGVVDNVNDGNSSSLTRSSLSPPMVDNNATLQVLPPSSGSPRRSRQSSTTSDLLTGMARSDFSGKPTTASVGENVHVADLVGGGGFVRLEDGQEDMDNVFGDTPMGIPIGLEGSEPRVPPVTTARRRPSHSEVIDRRPQLLDGVVLAPKSRTEIVGKNPNIPPLTQNQNLHQLQLQQQLLLRQQQQQLLQPQQQQQPRDAIDRLPMNQQRNQQTVFSSDPARLLLAPDTLANSAMPQYSNIVIDRRASSGVLQGSGIPGGARLPPQSAPNHAWQTNLRPANPTTVGTGLPPFEAEGCVVVSPSPSTSYSNTLSNISDVRSSSASSPRPRVPPQPQPYPPQQQRFTGHRDGSSDRLCPVCNQDFSHLSMDDFQTHIFDCFDNDNGPETLQAEMVDDYPPQWDGRHGPTPGRSCPMCQQKFDASVTQPEFEQHVHRHFGEEAFEVL